MFRNKLILFFILVIGLVYIWRQETKMKNISNQYISTETERQSRPMVSLNSPKLKESLRETHPTQQKPASLYGDSKQTPINVPNIKYQKNDKAPPPNSLPFVNYKGLAVAYGDVLLGKLDENVKSGFTSIPEVEYWSSSAIPYHIQPNVLRPERIHKALAYISQNTVIEFIPYDGSQPDAIVFEATEAHCLSYVGRISGSQPIFISDACQWPHVVHEVLHALGMIHEHSRPDRDQFISVKWEYIPDELQSQFSILPDPWVIPWMKYNYDPKSIMHYESQILDKKARGVSLTLKDGSLIPEPQAMTPLDIQKVNDLYQGR